MVVIHAVCFEEEHSLSDARAVFVWRTGKDDKR